MGAGRARAHRTEVPMRAVRSGHRPAAGGDRGWPARRPYFGGPRALSTGKGRCVRAVIEGRGRRALFLPPTSPELAPIAAAFAKAQTTPRNRP